MSQSWYVDLDAAGMRRQAVTVLMAAGMTPAEIAEVLVDDGAPASAIGGLLGSILTERAASVDLTAAIGIGALLRASLPPSPREAA